MFGNSLAYACNKVQFLYALTMLRVMLWKLGFIVLNVLSWCAAKSVFLQKLPLFCKKYTCFAFGANLGEDVLAKRKIQPLSVVDYVLGGYDLEFSQSSALVGVGFANIVKKPQAVVWGKLLTMRYIDVLRMHYFEAVPFLRKHNIVYEQDGTLSFYFYQTSNPKTGLLPSEIYLARMIKAAQQSVVCPKAYLKKLESHKSVANYQLAAKPVFLTSNYQSKAKLLRCFQQQYDRACMKLFLFLYPYNVVPYSKGKNSPS